MGSQPPVCLSGRVLTSHWSGASRYWALIGPYLEWWTLVIRVGDTSLDEEFEATAFTIGVKAIKQHPDYRIVTNDISILELAEAVSLTDFPNIKPVCLPEPGAQFPGEAIVSGWGTETSGGYLTSYLNEAGWPSLI